VVTAGILQVSFFFNQFLLRCRLSGGRNLPKRSLLSYAVAAITSYVVRTQKYMLSEVARDTYCGCNSWFQLSPVLRMTLLSDYSLLVAHILTSLTAVQDVDIEDVY